MHNTLTMNNHELYTSIMLCTDKPSQLTDDFQSLLHTGIHAPDTTHCQTHIQHTHYIKQILKHIINGTCNIDSSFTTIIFLWKHTVFGFHFGKNPVRSQTENHKIYNENRIEKNLACAGRSNETVPVDCTTFVSSTG